MNMTAMRESELIGDADLVASCLRGERDAFGRIVERYQSLICALAYSACGDLARSEDLTQETFLAAWRQLGALKQPAKLKHWLCGIVRNLTQNASRSQTRNPLATAVALEDELTAGPESDSPSDQAMSKEEEAILWRVLETLPRCYRDPLVLFYRGGDSTADVADALDMSEEAVRQRLARGRAMLDERVTRLVESGLRRSNPTKGLTLAVLAALPLAGTQAGVGSTAAASVQSAGALKTAGSAGAFAAAWTNLLPALGAVVGLWGHIENTRTSRERRFIVWSCLGLLGWVILLLMGAGFVSSGGSVFGLRVERPDINLSNAIRLSLFWLAFAGPLDAYAIWMALRQKRIRAEEAKSPQRPIEASRRGYRLSMFGSMLAMVAGATGWLFVVAHRAQDWTTLSVLALLCTAGWLGCAGLAVKRPKTKTVVQVFIWLWWGLVFVNLLTLNLRWSAWRAAVAPDAPPDLQAFLNVLICVFFASVRAGWFLKWRLLNVPTVKRDSLIALAVYLAVMLAGVALHQGIKLGDIPPVQAAQCMMNEIQSDGAIRFQSLSDTPNGSPAPLRELRFVNSDFVRIERVWSGSGRLLPFQVKHEPSTKTFAYVVPLAEAVLPGRTVSLKTEGFMTNQVHSLGAGEFEYFERHWPANGVSTLRVETYRLPIGAQVIETEPADMARRELPDGRVELRTQKIIPPNGDISVRIRFQR